jgi:hypothetical protein
LNNGTDQASAPGPCPTILSSYVFYAASYCSNLSYNGFSDWYLPSYAEMEVLRGQFGAGAPLAGVGSFRYGGGGDNAYWSSTGDTGTASRHHFNGALYWYPWDIPLPVRCVRRST